jgi:hypothetical protein
MRKALLAIAAAVCLAGCDSKFWIKDSEQEETGKTNQEAPAPTANPADTPGNAACWGDYTGQDISCRALTDDFLLSLRGATLAEVAKAMGGEGHGDAIPGPWWCGGGTCSTARHFVNYKKGAVGGTGALSFLFDQNGRVAVIFGSLDPSGDYDGDYGNPSDFIWNADLLPAGCSDLPRSHLAACSKNDILTLLVKIKRKSPTPRESFQSLARQSKGSKRLILSTTIV